MRLARSIPPLDLRDLRRFLSKIRFAPDGCWEWQAERLPRGYGKFCFMNARWLAHRVAYQEWVGPLDPALELDHAVCGNPRCCCPHHLEQVSHAENIRRGDAPRLLRQANQARASLTHCLRGHEYTPQNTYIDRRGRRACRACHRARMAACRERKRRSG